MTAIAYTKKPWKVVYENGTKINLIANATFMGGGGGGGSGTVTSVNGLFPDGSGNVALDYVRHTTPFRNGTGYGVAELETFGFPVVAFDSGSIITQPTVTLKSAGLSAPSFAYAEADSPGRPSPDAVLVGLDFDVSTVAGTWTTPSELGFSMVDSDGLTQRLRATVTGTGSPGFHSQGTLITKDDAAESSQTVSIIIDGGIDADAGDVALAIFSLYAGGGVMTDFTITNLVWRYMDISGARAIRAMAGPAGLYCDYWFTYGTNLSDFHTVLAGMSAANGITVFWDAPDSDPFQSGLYVYDSIDGSFLPATDQLRAPGAQLTVAHEYLPDGSGGTTRTNVEKVVTAMDPSTGIYTFHDLTWDGTLVPDPTGQPDGATLQVIGGVVQWVGP